MFVLLRLVKIARVKGDERDPDGLAKVLSPNSWSVVWENNIPVFGTVTLHSNSETQYLSDLAMLGSILSMFGYERKDW